jgi:Ricin-type beta-trefoil lectin domain-like
VYSIQNLAEPGNTMLEDNDVDGGNGALTNVWQAGAAQYQDPMASSSDPQILAANHLWEFVPASNNTGGTILTGTGELVNRQSGLCLDINGSDPNEYGDGATVDQWTCGGGANQQWGAFKAPSGTGYELYSGMDYSGSATQPATLRATATWCTRVSSPAPAPPGTSSRRATASPPTR